MQDKPIPVNLVREGKASEAPGPDDAVYEVDDVVVESDGTVHEKGSTQAKRASRQATPRGDKALPSGKRVAYRPFGFKDVSRGAADASGQKNTDAGEAAGEPASAPESRSYEVPPNWRRSYTPHERVWTHTATAQSTGDLSEAAAAAANQAERPADASRGRAEAARTRRRATARGGVPPARSSFQESRQASAHPDQADEKSAQAAGDDTSSARVRSRSATRGRAQAQAPKVPLKERVGAFAGSVVGAIKHIDVKMVLARLGVVAGVLAALALVFWGPVRDLYHAERDNMVLTAQLEAVEAQNAEELERVQSLQTEEGVVDEARDHGYVVSGEIPVTVVGLTDEPESEDASPIPPDVREQVLAQEDPWYIELGDSIFGYVKGEA